MTRTQCAQKLAATINAWLKTVGYAGTEAVVLKNFNGGKFPAVCAEIAGFSFMPFAASIEIEMDGIHTTIPWTTPAGCFAENWNDFTVTIYPSNH